MLPLNTSLVCFDTLIHIQELCRTGRLNIRIIFALYDDQQDHYVVLWESPDPRMQTWVDLITC